MAYNKPQEVLDALAHAYYEEKNTAAVLSCVTDDIEWVGTERHETATGKEKLKELLEQHFAAFPGALHVELAEPKVQAIRPDIAVLTLTGRKLETPGATVKFSVRGTVCCVKTEQGWLIFSLHMSAPNAAAEKASLVNALDEERAKQKALLDNVPGGIAIYRVKKDGRIPADYVSDNLARLCGYDNGEEALKAIGEDALTHVLQEDYPAVAEACKASIAQGVPTSVQYRVCSKDGSPVRLTLDAVIMQNEPLGEDDAAVFYAVQTLVSKEASQKAEEQKTLISLLNTVPTGIGIFEVNESGIKQNYMNDAFYQLIGTKREERIQYNGANSLSTAHPMDVEKLRQAMKRLLHGENSVQMYYRVMSGAGTWAWLHLNACVVTRHDNLAVVHAAFYECTESRQQQLQLLQSQRAVALAEQQGQMAIWTYNIDKGVIAQQIMGDGVGHMGYPDKIADVPKCFIGTGHVYPDDEEKYEDAYTKLADGAEKVDVIYRMKNRNTGKYDWVHMFYKRMENNDDDDRMAVGFSLLVNAQQEAIERYQTEQKLRERMYANSTIYLEYNLTDRKYEGKNTFESRYPTVQWQSKTIEEFREKMSAVVDERYLDEIAENVYADNLLKSFEQGKTKVSCEYRSKERPGMPSTWYRITYTMVKRPDTGDVMVFVCVEDIEGDKDRQFAIESSMSDGIESVGIIQVADGKTRLIMERGRRLRKNEEKHFTYDDDFVKRASRATVSEERDFSYKAALLAAVEKHLDKQEIYRYTISTVLEDGNKKRKLFSFRYLDDRRTNVVMSVSDVTALYLEEQEKKRQLENALEQAKEASRAKAEFYSRMSHDMRTPMNGVLGMVALSEDENDSAKLKENIGKIKESGEYLLSLINDTLDLQRIESGKMKLEPTIVNTADVIRNIVEMVSVTAKAKGVFLKCNHGNADLHGYIRADALRLKQIFINLLSNAVKFTPVGGTVAFDFELLSREGMISHDVVYVRDTGVGMSKDFLENGIFKAFSQERNEVSANYAGSGLGLSIAKSLVEMMGGRIEVESELGAGTTFAVYLDFERVDEAEAKAALQREKDHSEGVSKQLKGKKILLAEDHPLNAEIAEKLLQKVGCEVTWAKNGQEAVSRFAEVPAGAFDIILMDIRMPVMDGLEATREIRALDKADAATIPIIAMTANAYSEDRKEALAAGMNAHLGKPIEPNVMYQVLGSYLK